MDRLIVLLRNRESESVADFNRRWLTDAGPAWAADADYLSIHLVDEIAAEGAGGSVTSEPRFDGLVEIGTAAALTDWVERCSSSEETSHLYRVNSRRVKHYTRNWNDGERTPGLFMISPVYRAAHLSAEEFDVHWRERHAPLALRHHCGMWDYRQSPVLEVVSKGAPAFDGFAHMGFPSVEAFRTGLFDSPDGMTHIMEDTERFLDLPRSESALMGETILKS